MASDQTTIVLVSKLSDNSYLTLCLFDHCTSPTSHLEDSEDIQEKFPPRHFQCFRVGRRIALIREHFCVNWLNLEAIWRRPRHMLRTHGHLSKVQATLGEQGEVMWGRGCGGSSAIISDFKAGCSVQGIAMGYVLDWRPIYNYC